MLTQSKLQEQLHYDPLTGIFTRKTSMFKNRIGEEAGTLQPHGYIKISVFNKQYYAHRLAILYMTGVMPSSVDHINRIKDDNRWDNLREAGHIENSRNCSLSKNNTSGHNGVYYRKDSNNWRASIHVNYKKINLGTYSTKEEAIFARREAEKEYGFHPRHGLEP